MKLDSLQELYTEQLRDLYDAEQQIIEALPEMIELCNVEVLRQCLLQVFRCGREGSDLIGKIEEPDVRDAAIIASAQRVEHYEMAGYGTARTFATLLEDKDAVKLLQQTLDEEKEADQKLTELTEEINVNASEGKTVEGEIFPNQRRAKQHK